MAQTDDARLSAVLADVLAEGDTAELFRRLLREALQELIDEELPAAIGAAPHERTDTRTNQRNGGRTKLLSTPTGDVELRIPKVKVGSFFPSLLEPRRRVDRALWTVIMSAYVHGTSTRKVDDLVRALGCDTGRSLMSRPTGRPPGCWPSCCRGRWESGKVTAALVERWQAGATKLLTTEGARRRARLDWRGGHPTSRTPTSPSSRNSGGA